jgi:hypothetical protein
MTHVLQDNVVRDAGGCGGMGRGVVPVHGGGQSGGGRAPGLPPPPPPPPQRCHTVLLTKLVVGMMNMGHLTGMKTAKTLGVMISMTKMHR